MRVATAVSEANLGRSASCGEDRGGKGDKLRQFSADFGRRPIKSLLGFARAAKPKLVELQDALQMREEHLDPLSFTTRDSVGLGPCDGARLLASSFVDGSRDLAGWRTLGLQAS